MGYMRVNEQTVHSCSAYFYLLANYQNKSSMVCHLKIKKLEITVSFLYLLYNIVTIYFLFCLIFLFNNHHNKNNDIFYSNIELVKNSGNVPFEIWPQVERYFWNCCRKILELVNLSIKSHIFKFFLNRSALKGFYTKKNLQSKNEFLAFFFFFFAILHIVQPYCHLCNWIWWFTLSLTLSNVIVSSALNSSMQAMSLSITPAQTAAWRKQIFEQLSERSKREMENFMHYEQAIEQVVHTHITV